MGAYMNVPARTKKWGYREGYSDYVRVEHRHQHQAVSLHAHTRLNRSPAR